MGSSGRTWVGAAWIGITLEPPFPTARTSGVEMCGSLSAASCYSGKEQGGKGMWQPEPVCLCFCFHMETGLCPELRLRSSEALPAGFQPGMEELCLSQPSLPTHEVSYFRKVDGVLESPRIFA